MRCAASGLFVIWVIVEVMKIKRSSLSLSRADICAVSSLAEDWFTASVNRAKSVAKAVRSSWGMPSGSFGSKLISSGDSESPPPPASRFP